MASETPDDVPVAVDEIVQELGIFVPPNVAELSPAEREIFDNATAGRCMTCGGACGVHTFAVIGQPIGLEKPVVVMLFCGGACLTDMQVLGWIQQQHADMREAINFRGGQGGN